MEPIFCWTHSRFLVKLTTCDDLSIKNIYFTGGNNPTPFQPRHHCHGAICVVHLCLSTERSLVYILSFRHSSIKYTMHTQAKKDFCNVTKKENDWGGKSAANCCCVLRRKPPICAEKRSSEATKETCSRTPVRCREQFVRSILSVQHCTSHV